MKVLLFFNILSIKFNAFSHSTAPLLKHEQEAIFRKVAEHSVGGLYQLIFIMKIASSKWALHFWKKPEIAGREIWRIRRVSELFDVVTAKK